MAPYGKKGGKPPPPRGGRSGVKASGPTTANNKKKKSGIRTGPNPFDVRSNAKTKYEVLGRRVKGTGRNVAAARADAEAKRKKSLATQFKLRHKANAFQDRRLGETDPDMTLEDKMMARFQTERKRKMRNAQAFALHDSDDDDRDGDELFLTHGGQKIDDYDTLNGGGTSAFNDDGDDDDETRKMDREIITKLHFGGGEHAGTETQPDHKKTHKEIMQEVMVKSKLFKAERQKNKAAQEDTTEQLDDEFDALKNLLSFRPTKGTKEYDAIMREEKKAAPPDDFDKLTRELTFEAKAQATERRVSPEEAAKREHDRLAALEKKRVARMNGVDDDDSDAETGRAKRGGKKGSKKKAEIIMLPPQTDDDLAFDYAMDQQFGVVQEEEEEEEDAEEDEDDEKEEEDSDADSDEEEKEEEAEEEEDEEEEEEEEEEEAEDAEDEAKATKKAERLRKRQEAAAELPFVFPCPESLEDLTALFRQHAHNLPERRAQIVERIIKYYSVKLSAANQPLMRSFFAILVRQFLKYAKSYAIYKPDLDALASQLFLLAQDVSEAAGIIVRELLTNVHKRLHSTKAVSKYPSFAELLLFKALIQLFPTSDLRHNVVSPLETLLSESLVRGGLETRTDVVHAMVTATLLLQMTKEKQRFTPEVIVFFRKVLRAFAVTESPHWLRTELLTWRTSHTADTPLPTLKLTEISSASAPAILRAVLALVELASAQYGALPSVDELLYPSYLLLHEISQSLFESHNDQLHTVITHLHTRLTDCWNTREPLRLQTFGPSVLPAFTPKFDANYTVRKDKTLDREQAQTKQLQRQVKRARKNAARELRRDASFLAREQQTEDAVRVAAKKEKQREIWQWLEEQNATFNQQAKKGGEMLTGGGSGPAKKRRVARK